MPKHAYYVKLCYTMPTVPYTIQNWSPRGRPWPRGRPRGHILKPFALISKPTSS